MKKQRAIRVMDFEFEAGGYPLPIYRGTGRVTLLATEDEEDDLQSLKVRARRQAANSMQMTLPKISITKWHSSLQND